MNSTITRSIPTLNGNTLQGDKTLYGVGILTNVVSKSSSDVSIASSGSTITYLCPITLTKGTWLIRYTITYSANANGVRRMGVAYASGSSYAEYAWSVVQLPAGSAGEMAIRNTTAIITSGTTTVAVSALQNSGSALTITNVRIDAWRL